MIGPPTQEETPVHLKHWLSQRSRWLRVRLQTWLGLMRQPLEAIRGMGLAGFFSMQRILGGSLLAALLQGLVMAWLVAVFFLPDMGVAGWQAALLGLGYSGVAAAALGAPKGVAPPWAFVTWPLYWPRISIAMLRGLWEMRAQPHRWAKTPHGVVTPGRLKRGAT